MVVFYELTDLRTQRTLSTFFSTTATFSQLIDVIFPSTTLGLGVPSRSNLRKNIGNTEFVKILKKK